jgi:predicted TIM-barrel fold metal-dependent hydrolase
MPGGKGILLEDGHPRHVDRVAARFPQLKILAGRPAWPWQDDMIAVLLHKANVHYELHGWSPKYFTPALKKEIGWRLQDRVMFGWDWPTLTLERLTDDWRTLGYSEEVYEKVFHRNAEGFFPGAAPKGGA